MLHVGRERLPRKNGRTPGRNEIESERVAIGKKPIDLLSTSTPSLPHHFFATSSLSSRPPRLFLAAAAAAAAFAVGRLAGSWPQGLSSSAPFGGDPRLCDPKIGCTPLQLAAKRRTPLAAGRKHAFKSVQEAWGIPSIDLIDVVDKVIGEKNLRCVVNLGALDGLTDDPTYPLFKRGACGAAFEGDELILDALEDNLAPFRATGVAIMKEYAHPVTMPARLRAAGMTADNLDVLKVDVDGFDLALARSILEAGFRPKVVLMESNTDVPAPFAYETSYRHDYGVYFQ